MDYPLQTERVRSWLLLWGKWSFLSACSVHDDQLWRPLMLYVLAICCAMIGDDGKPAKTPPADLSAYESARAKVGKDANSHVQLALWCEEHGLSAERVKHLALAVAQDPTNGLARAAGHGCLPGEMGKARGSRETHSMRSCLPEHVREYLDRRAKAAHKPDAQLKLAAWCNQKRTEGASPGALQRGRSTRSIPRDRLDASRIQEAWQPLGQARSGRGSKARGRAAETRGSALETSAWKNFARVWRAPMPRSETRPGREWPKSPTRGGSDDLPRLRQWRRESQVAAVGMLSQIEGPSASNALATLAVFSPSKEVRSRAADNLSHRDPRDVVGRLINLIRPPFKYKVRPGNGPGTTGELLVEGEAFNLQRLYQYSMIDLRTIPVSPPISMQMPGDARRAATRTRHSSAPSRGQQKNHAAQNNASGE